MRIDADLAIVGAGTAGLNAARAAAERGASSVILEARDRVGGRVFPLDDPALSVAVELGAEFVHGTPPETLALLRLAGTALLDTGERSFRRVDGALRESDDVFAAVHLAMTRAASLREDVSVAAFVAPLDPRTRAVVRAMVSGFDAADPERASVLALAAEWDGESGGQTSASFRPAGGYAPLLRALRGALPADRVRLLTQTPVRAVATRGDGVVVDALGPAGAAVTVRARAAIVTVPVGVLQAGAITFDPPLPATVRGALAGLPMGPVHKLILRFRTRFWEDVDGGRFGDAAFFQDPALAFPTCWTLVPQRAPILVAWAGGPYADALAAATPDERIARALDAAASFFGDAAVRDAFEGAYAHDWQADPYARGAYSYVAVGALRARAVLAAPVGGRLFFAGEAAIEAADAGTVGGALRSGAAAARAALGG